MFVIDKEDDGDKPKVNRDSMPSFISVGLHGGGTDDERDDGHDQKEPQDSKDDLKAQESPRRFVVYDFRHHHQEVYQATYDEEC